MRVFGVNEGTTVVMAVVQFVGGVEMAVKAVIVVMVVVKIMCFMSLGNYFSPPTKVCTFSLQWFFIEIKAKEKQKIWKKMCLYIIICVCGGGVATSPPD